MADDTAKSGMEAVPRLGLETPNYQVTDKPHIGNYGPREDENASVPFSPHHGNP